jgi:arsenate reductase-like glutaredoxin family protein
VRIAADTATVLGFEAPLDPVRTQLQEGAQAGFEPLAVAGRLITLLPLAGVERWRTVTLLVAFADGKVLPLRLAPGTRAEADTRVEVFANPFTQGALFAALEQAEADNTALQRRLDEALAELERYRQEEDSPDALLAALLLDERMTRRFVRVDRVQFRSKRLRADIEILKGGGRTAIVVMVQNLDPLVPWSLRDISFTNEKSGARRDFAFRARPATIPAGSSGRVVVVSESLAESGAASFRLVLCPREDSERGLQVMRLMY